MLTSITSRITNRLRGSGQLKKNMLSGMVASGGGALLMAFSYPFYLSKIGYHTYGIWIALTIVVSVSQVGNLGMSQALVRRVAECFETGRFDQIRSYYSTAFFTVSTLALVLFCSLMTCKPLVTRLIGLHPQEASAYSALISGVFVLSVLTFVVDIASSVLSGLGRIDLYNYTQLVIQAVAVVGSVVAVYSGFHLEGLLAAQLCGYLTGLTFSFVVVTRKLGRWPLHWASYSTAHLKQLIGEGSLLAGSWIMSLVFHPINKILLAHAGFFADLPIYEISVNLSMRLRNFFESSQRALMPETSRLISGCENPRQAIAVLLRSSVKGVLIGAAPAYAIIFLFASPITRLWLRHSFVEAVPSTLQVFLIGTFISLLGTPFYYALIGMGRAASVLIANAVQLAVCSLGVYILLHSGLLRKGWHLAQVLAVADIALVASTTLLAVAAVKTIKLLRTPQVREVTEIAA